MKIIPILLSVLLFGTSLAAAPCTNLTTINTYQLNTSFETIEDRLRPAYTISKETIADETILVAKPLGDTTADEYFRFKNNELYQYVRKIDNPDSTLVDQMYKTLDGVCGKLTSSEDKVAITFTVNTSTGFYIKFAVPTHTNSQSFALVIYGYQPTSINRIN